MDGLCPVQNDLNTFWEKILRISGKADMIQKIKGVPFFRKMGKSQNAIRNKTIIGILLLILCIQIISAVIQSVQINADYKRDYIRGAENLSRLVFSPLDKMIKTAKSLEPQVTDSDLAGDISIYIRIVQQKEFDHLLKLDDDLTALSFLNRQGQVIISSSKNEAGIIHSGLESEVSAARTDDYSGIVGEESIGIARTENRVNLFIPYHLEGTYLGGLVFSYDTSRLNAARWRTYKTAGLLVAVYMVFAAILVYLFVNRVLTRPVRELTSMMKKMAGGEYNQWFNIRNMDEIGQMGKSVNELIASLQKTYSEIREGISGEESDLVSNEIERARTELRVLSRKLIHTIEEERKKIAVDLHDEVGKTLTILQCELGIIEQALESSGEEDREHCQNAIHETRKLAAVIRSTCSRLRPDLLDDLGLTSAIQNQLDNINKNIKALELNFSHNVSDVRLGPEIELTLYRVFQEAMNNVIKHSNADEVTITLMLQKDHVVMKIEDNGCGFQQDERGLPRNAETEGIGLLSMKERVYSINGKISIVSGRRKGTGITVELPTGG